MNELSNKVFSELAGVRNFLKGKAENGEKIRFDQIDIKLFYLFQGNKEVTSARAAKRGKMSSQDESKHSTVSSKVEKTEHSIRDISLLDTKDLKSKIFTFDPKLGAEDITKMEGEGKNIQNIVKGLPSMRGIDEDYIPQFKFIQFKKSEIKNADDQDRLMLCFTDISQKILYDTTKAEGEFLTLINSTISHEMRNPLNSIIN